MSKSSGSSFTRRFARRSGHSLKNITSMLGKSLMKAEEEFVEYLSLIKTVALNVLLPDDVGDEVDNLNLLQVLSKRFHALWELTVTGYKTLKQQQNEHSALGMADLYLINQNSDFLHAYIQYFESVTNYMVVNGFDRAAKQTSNHWKSNKKILKQVIEETSDIPVPILLQRAFVDPFKAHVQQYTQLLSQMDGKVTQDPEFSPLKDALDAFVKLQSHINQALDEGFQTNLLWTSSSHKLTSALFTPERRIQEDSRNTPITVSTGRFDRVLLFNDVLVLLQGNEVHSYELKTVWADPSTKRKSDTHNYILRIITPEEEFILSAKEPQHQVLWLWKMNQLIRQELNGSRDFPLWGKTGEVNDPPTCRLSTYTYKNDGRFKGATYEGDMSWGKPHGKGTLKWPDGRNHVGDFKFGQEDGFGICLVPSSLQDRFDCYKCHWRSGSMVGYGICEYADESVYKGYFKDDMRHGFGIMEKPEPNPYKYIGNWDKDLKSGYGVWENADRGEKYIGMWQDNQRNGPGIVLTHSGTCYQGIFNFNKLVGTGVLLSEDSTVYEGEFTEECLLAGKGKLTFSNGFTLVGTFNRNGGASGLLTQGVLNTTCDQQDEMEKRKFQLGAGLFSVEARWEGIFKQFQKFLESGCKGETEESFLGFHVKSSKKLHKSQEYLYCQRGNDEVSGKIEDIMKEISVLQEPEAVQCYLEKAFRSSHHPFRKLMKILFVVFQATYSGIGANLHLLSMAQEEIKYYAKKVWEFYRALQGMAAEQGHQTLLPVEDQEESDERSAYTLILPLILPRLHPDLFMLYMLYHQQEDAAYWQGIVRLGLLTDTKLLEFLDVQKQLWPLKDVKLTANQRYSIVRHKCFLSAIECLQKIISTVDPKEKLEIILKTYSEIEKTVSRVVDKDYKLPMDDLLPLLIYVVSRAGIQHLGAEIHFIHDLMDPSNRGGIYDFLLTALESCYEHIQKEEIRHYKC